MSREEDEPLGAKSTDSCFRITIKLLTTKRATGKYWCRTIGMDMEESNSSWLYLYGNGNNISIPF